MPQEVRPPGLRIRQGVALLAAGVVFVLIVGDSADRFYLTPLGIGLAYLLAAALGGRRGGYWATAVVLVGWGAAVLWAHEGRPDLDIAGMYLAGAGLGVVVGVLLSRAGFAVNPLGLAATVMAGGLLLALSGQWPDVIEEARIYGVLVGIVGLANVIAGVLGVGDSEEEPA